MTINFNDPRLTAYALGELDEKERAEIEALLAGSEDARREVEDIRRTSELLTQELAAEPSPGLSDAQRAALANRLAETDGRAARPAKRRRFLRPRVWIPTALAASFVLAAGVAYFNWPSLLSQASRPSNELANLSHVKDDATSSRVHGVGQEQSLWIRSVPSAREAPTARRERLTRDKEGSEVVASTSDRALHGVTREEMARMIAEAPAKLFICPSSTEGSYSDSGNPPPVDFSQYENVSYGYQVPQPPAAQPPAVPGGGGGQSILGGSAERVGGSSPGHGRPLDKIPPEQLSRLLAEIGSRVPDMGRSAPGSLSEAEMPDDPELMEDLKRLIAAQLAAGADLGFSTEAYDHIVENPFLLVTQEPLSTFSIDVDTASYANIRRYLTGGQFPPAAAVRLEEMINYFTYDYPQPAGDEPFSVNVAIADCPWDGRHRLARIGLKGYEIPDDERPASNLVFLIDVSGSMQPANKLPLLKQSMRMLVNNLRDDDSVAIVVYAGSSGEVLSPTYGFARGEILAALDRLQSGGNTNGGAGIQLAYDLAVSRYIEGGINRVILATDGDFNVGVTSQGELVELIERKAKSGVFLTVLGFGMGNLKDSTLEKLADKGNGNYAYIDTLNEAQKVLVEEMGATLMTIAKDVKIQIEFNPATVAAYRLLGYENRLLAAQDFNDDTKDAGEIGAGHTVTALYEIILAGEAVDVPEVDPLKYQAATAVAPAAMSGETMTVKLRYKEPEEDESSLLEFPVTDSGTTLADASDDFAFAAAVASFGMLLRDSPYQGDWSYDAAIELAGSALGDDAFGYRAEFIDLVARARDLAARQP